MHEKLILPNGVRIIYENVPSVRSVACGIWVGVGSRFEKPSENGASHFIEHMVFKGTKTRTSYQLAELMDGVGGQINAFTGKDCTCYYGRVLDTHLPLLTDVLCDMFFNSVFAEDCVESERGVICEEIDMYEDSPDDLAAERLTAAVFRGSSLSRPVLGTKRSLSKMTGASLLKYMKTHYGPHNIVVALSGSFKKSDVLAIAARFESMSSVDLRKTKAAVYVPDFKVKKKSIEQNHICLGFPGVSVSSQSRYAFHLMSEILGGGMSSRLFQTLREDRGLCYSVCSCGVSYTDCGLITLYAGLSSENETEALPVMIDELKKLTDSGVSETELSRVREQVKANSLMGLESTSRRSSFLGRNELFLGEIPSTDEIIRLYDSVTVSDILLAARECFKQENLSFSAVGRVRTADEYREILK